MALTISALLGIDVATDVVEEVVVDVDAVHHHLQHLEAHSLAPEASRPASESSESPASSELPARPASYASSAVDVTTLVAASPVQESGVRQEGQHGIGTAFKAIALAAMIVLGAISGTGEAPSGHRAEPLPQRTSHAAESGAARQEAGSPLWQTRLCDMQIPLPVALVHRLGERSAEGVVEGFNHAALGMRELLIRELPRTSTSGVQVQGVQFSLVDDALLVKMDIAYATTIATAHAAAEDVFELMREAAYKLLREKLQAVAALLERNTEVAASVTMVVDRQLGERRPH